MAIPRLTPILPLDPVPDLVARCLLGDRRAQYDLYKRYAKAMYNVCKRIVGHDAEAEDVLQDAFVDAFGNLHRFRGESTFGAWLKQIVVNRAVGCLRTRRLPLVSTETLDNENFDRAEEGEGIDEAQMQWDVERVRQAVARLPDGYRVVLTLYLFDGYDHDEIGQILSISESTSRSQYLRAKRKLISEL
ncbi:RNA polymerase sigma factor [Fibrella aquatilis]|uniref:RNA polymerase sigma factor n=1 Tax=Fibrella aquatilis TaxID=2817059 RepID=A0A939GCE9_9BACT|nr:sigma-70 family RNA polymerase sigma factor [Fibrella aquatilis]MBO0934260.1 sigma-70 family RNA polymerase sigma factor [Fibrella aquatilis]